MSPKVLGPALAVLTYPGHPRLLVDVSTSDDAGVFQLTDELALVQTVDFLTPIVNDPRMFGRIAAANALSDVYAMGGRPLTALCVACYPRDLEAEGLALITAGAREAADEADTVIVGGHTVMDPELKFGLAVTGIVHPRHIVTNSGARESDLLLLTKELGTGIVSTALKRRRATPAAEQRIVESMCRLNRYACEAMEPFAIAGATDVTGFGLLGHGLELARASSVSLELWASAIPVFADAVVLARDRANLTRGDVTNRAYAEGHVAVDAAIPEELIRVFYDPQTSGGLLIAVPRERATELLERIHAGGDAAARIIGRVGRGPVRIVVAPDASHEPS
ncbi:MAG: selenide, water dikinase SelD [Candidatus Schekmanbacteria bacterium]|nr:selenide, water dikinase SelD [Candidatus Schekmanbacteria bacterium]